MTSTVSARRLILLCVIVSAVIPMLNTLLLGSVTTMLASDVMIPAAASSVTGFISDLISVAAAFAAAACLSCAGVTGVRRRTIALIAMLSVPFTYVVAGIVDAAFYSSTVLNGAYILFSLISCLFELLRCVLVFVIALLIAGIGKRRERPMTLELLSVSGTLSISAISAAAVTGVSMLMSNLTETISLFMEYGAPVNTSETLTLVSPYITTVIFTILGYFLSYLMHRAMQRKEETV